LADEEGDARSYRRKTSVAARVAGLLERTGFPSCDVAVDPGVCPVPASGIGEEDTSGMPSYRTIDRFIKRSACIKA